jgi:hypothetical protein
MAEDRNKTVNRPDDGRLKGGARILFDRTTEREALYTARLMKRLTPEYQKAVRLLAECCVEEQLLAEFDRAVDEKGRA